MCTGRSVPCKEKVRMRILPFFFSLEFPHIPKVEVRRGLSSEESEILPVNNENKIDMHIFKNALSTS